jgi:hypothetical protein
MIRGRKDIVNASAVLLGKGRPFDNPAANGFSRGSDVGCEEWQP